MAQQADLNTFIESVLTPPPEAPRKYKVRLTQLREPLVRALMRAYPDREQTLELLLSHRVEIGPYSEVRLVNPAAKKKIWLSRYRKKSAVALKQELARRGVKIDLWDVKYYQRIELSRKQMFLKPP